MGSDSSMKLELEPDGGGVSYGMSLNSGRRRAAFDSPLDEVDRVSETT